MSNFQKTKEKKKALLHCEEMGWKMITSDSLLWDRPKGVNLESYILNIFSPNEFPTSHTNKSVMTITFISLKQTSGPVLTKHLILPLRVLLSYTKSFLLKVLSKNPIPKAG